MIRVRIKLKIRIRIEAATTACVVDLSYTLGATIGSQSAMAADDARRCAKNQRFQQSAETDPCRSVRPMPNSNTGLR